MGEDCQQILESADEKVEQTTNEEALRERLLKQDLSPLKRFEFNVLPLFA